MSKPARIQTTVVGSYPIPEWLVALPSEQALIDATRVVIDTQEQAGIDVVCDGELYRFDVNHPETNGMIEYFVRPLKGVRTEISFDELFMERYDAILTPAALGTAPKGLGATGDPVFCTPWTLFGMPAISLPLLKGENGLPLGVQLVGRREFDARLMRTARWLVSRTSS